MGLLRGTEPVCPEHTLELLGGSAFQEVGPKDKITRRQRRRGDGEETGLRPASEHNAEVQPTCRVRFLKREVWSSHPTCVHVVIHVRFSLGVRSSQQEFI